MKTLDLDRPGLVRLFLSILVPTLGGAIVGYFTLPSIQSWYRGLDKPTWTPPDWAFGPVWTVLYALMGIAFWRIWRTGTRSPDYMKAVALYGGQLSLNFLWSVLFFGLQQPLWALVEIVGLWVLILGTLYLFFRLDRIAGWLIVPYLAWVTIALSLNAGIWALNS